MKATFTGLAALLVSTFMLPAAHGQTPIPVSPSAYNGVYLASAWGGGPATGAATGCDCGGVHGKGGWLGKLGGGHHGDCGGLGWGRNNACGGGCAGGGICAAIKSWLCRPYPSNAPSCQRPDYPLGFPMHPYVRSPRDFFMQDVP
jgi:hypothetical protein